MTYFELFNIPISLLVDATSIKKRFYELSRRYHPDFFSNSTSEKQDDALEMSALVNKALKVLCNPDETIKYVLQLKGLLEEEEKYQLPNDFLMDVMDINEQLMDAKVDGDDEQMVALKQQIADLQKKIYEPVKETVEHYQEGVTSEKELLQIKKYYFQKKYLDRLLSGTFS